ncbi:MAG: CoA transferase [Intestinimonas sp.]|jgi:CoA:oxalate CoA-transferase|nr:CoA transferase [Intestinimonas sp.]
MSEILEGIRVLDLGRIISAPYAAMLMADMGAEVIKVEKPEIGDDLRIMAEFDFPSINRNKKSVTIQFRSEEGKKLLRGLIEKSDVILENFRPGTMEKMGFGYEEVKRINPRIIMASISGFGQTGPYKERAAFDSIIQAMSGIMSVTGTKESGPSRIGAPLLDHISGLFAFSGILMALYNREKTGEGQYIDVSMLDSAVPTLFTHIPNYSALGIIAGSEDTNAPTAVPAGTYKAKDGLIYLNGGTVKLFKIIRNIIKSEELMQEKYISQEYRQKHHQVVNKIVANWVAEHTCDEVDEIMTEGGVPTGIVSTIDRVIKNPQVIARNTIVDIDVPGYGKVKFGGNPIKMSTHPVEEYRPAHTLGADNEDIYGGLLGLSPKELEDLKAKKAI